MVKVRFAPSPTGYLHVGNARTAILNYLFAKRHMGAFILRIEDTDRARSNPAFTKALINDLSWLGIKWDEGPYLQSERLHIYKEYAERMVAEKLAYKCFCSKERLTEIRQERLKSRKAPKYDGKCRYLSDMERAKLESNEVPYVIRFLAPQKDVKFKDMIFGEIGFPSGYVDDFILIKADGTPSYNFAAALDDMLMGITHVIRGRDHIPNTPKQILLFEALGKSHPTYGHHPLLLEKDGKPLSKREGSKEIRTLRELGILPEAIFNYLGVLGRKIDREITDIKALIESFSIDSVSKSDAIFDFQKLLWLNKQHIKTLTSRELILRANLKEEDTQILEALKDNIETLSDVKEMVDIFKSSKLSEEGIEFLQGVKDGERIAKILKEALKNNQNVSFQSLTVKLKEEGISLTKENMLTLRVLLTGRKIGPPIDSILSLIPKEIILGRIECYLTSS
ncbi:MAG: glutamate--tRNA ligase [Deltaproteobacteria bacterium]|nr:glutamate--tRNA ligase [Deltaproteobacteria bacterium]